MGVAAMGVATEAAVTAGLAMEATPRIRFTAERIS